MLQADSSTFRASSSPDQLFAYRYFVYGITLHSEIPLPLAEQGHGELGQIQLRMASPARFYQAARSLKAQPNADCFYQSIVLRDGSTYVGWEGVGQFLISSDGCRIAGRQCAKAHPESFQVYLLGQALSYALVKQGFEPLHATATVVDGEAAILLGSSGLGKSSLAACFLAARYRLLTDELLILRPSSRGVMAYPGPPRIKLFPRLARRFLPEMAGGVAMNPASSKLVLPLDRDRSVRAPVPVKAIYALLPIASRSRKATIRISVMPRRESFIALVKHTFNYRIVNPARLERQFEAGTQVVGIMPVKEISYPRVLARLPQVRDGILADIKALNEQQAACRD